MKVCRHCQVTQVSRPRGLCWSCYYTAGVREMYPSTSKFGRRGVGNFHGLAAQPIYATNAEPGSEAKIAILAERVRLKQSLWHPHDATLVGPVPGAITAPEAELVLQAS